MNKNTITLAILVVAGVLTSNDVRWMDGECSAWAAKMNKEILDKYGEFAIQPYEANTNWSIAILSNGKAVELGFRGDGVVVWREKETR